MNRLFFLVFAWILATGMARAEDVVHLTDGRALRGEILLDDEREVRLRMQRQLSGGRTGSVTETIPWTQIDFIEFASTPEAEAIFANPADASLDDLEKLWLENLKYLGRPRSIAGRAGLLFAGRLRESDSEFAWGRAVSLLQRIESGDWNPERQREARRLRLQVMIRQGKIDEAVREARLMVDEAEDPTVVLEAKHVLATIRFDQLKALEEENPRWERDDEVRPVRNEHYHEALDLSLYPFLFHGWQTEASARGLLQAARIYRHGGDNRRARLCAKDILRHYPTSDAANAARILLDELPTKSTP